MQHDDPRLLASSASAATERMPPEKAILSTPSEPTFSHSVVGKRTLAVRPEADVPLPTHSAVRDDIVIAGQRT